MYSTDVFYRCIPQVYSRQPFHTWIIPKYFIQVFYTSILQMDSIQVFNTRNLPKYSAKVFYTSILHLHLRPVLHRYIVHIYYTCILQIYSTQVFYRYIPHPRIFETITLRIPPKHKPPKASHTHPTTTAHPPNLLPAAYSPGSETPECDAGHRARYRHATGTQLPPK